MFPIIFAFFGRRKSSLPESEIQTAANDSNGLLKSIQSTEDDATKSSVKKKHLPFANWRGPAVSTIAVFASAVLYLLSSNPAYAVWETLVDGTSFNSTNAFQSLWNYDYPWGSDHNGSARMFSTNVTFSGGVMTLTSWLTNSYEGASSKSPYLTIRYNSGTVYLKQELTISAQYPILDVSGDFQVPSQTGAWPAFWLTGVNTWPPESDMMEFKGGSTCGQNTYNGSWQISLTSVSSPASWHTYRMIATLVNSTNVDLHYYIDGVMKSVQTSTTFVGSPLWLIIDYQMEGSSGSPGPSYTTQMAAKNIVVKRENISGVAAGPVSNGTYALLVRSTSQCLDVANQSTTNGSYLIQWPYNAGINEQWSISHRGNSQYVIMGRQSGRALEVAGSSTNNGAGTDVSDYGAGSNQIWGLSASSNGYYNLVNVQSGKALEVYSNSTSEGAVVDQWRIAGDLTPQAGSISRLGTNIVLSGQGGAAGIGYSIFSSTNIFIPRTNWPMIATGTFNGSGGFSFTNGIGLEAAQMFFQLRATNYGSNQQWIFQAP
jgi:Ricin-type beta-trefoil lectin domain-like